MALREELLGHISYQTRNKSRDTQKVALCDKVLITRLSLVFSTTHSKFKDTFQQR